MSKKVVYLDQNKWIDIARIYHGKDSSPDARRALSRARDKVEQGVVVFPLSWVHYIETAKNRNHEQRARLGTVMWELSRGYTMASYYHIVCYELESALARRFQTVTPRTFDLLSTGVAHAFGEEYSFELPEEFRSSMPVAEVEALESEGQQMLEKAAITGEGPGGIRMTSPEPTQYNDRFKKHLETLHPRLSRLSPKEREDALYATALTDIKEPLKDVLRLHRLSWQQHLEPLGKDGLTSLVEELPSRRIEVQLHRQLLKNPQLKPRVNDLEDWGGLGPASAHCGVVVCEKHFADLLLRDGFSPKAEISTDVKEFPDVV